MKNRSSKFLTPPKHCLDHAQQVRMTKAVNSLLNGQVVVGKVPRIHYSDGNMMIEIPQGGAGAQIFQITAIDFTDSFSAQAWDGTSLSGPIITIAKQIDFRPSFTTQVVDGVTVTHVFSDDNHRTSDDGVNSQTEVCQPRFAVGNEVVVAQSLNSTPVAGADYIDLTDRVWMTYT